MTLENLNTEYENKKVFMYAKDGNTIVRHSKRMRKITDNIYAGEPENNGYGNYCNIYLVFDSVERGIKYCNTSVCNDVETIVNAVHKDRHDTLEGIISVINEAVENQRHVPMLYVEFIRQFRTDMIPAMMDARKAYKEKLDRKHEEERAKREAEEAERIKVTMEKTNSVISSAIETLKNGGKLENKRITVYKTNSDCNEYSIVNYLCRQYGVNIPLRTAGWVNDKLHSLNIADGKCCSLQWYKRSKTAKCSQSIYGYINQLIEKVSQEA